MGVASSHPASSAKLQKNPSLSHFKEIGAGGGEAFVAVIVRFLKNEWVSSGNKIETANAVPTNQSSECEHNIRTISSPF